ncbi:MAG: GNAT family N-acetyltransferase [Cytophagaceae bacterium]|nr:MAG: GNAT family N-acetyltransferase [Cytophagaceae bacterium]
MQPTSDQRQYTLTEEQNQSLFDDIWLDTVDQLTAVSNPIALFLGGQPGSGKSGLAQHHLKQFADRGGVVLINSDALREYHPSFALLQRTDADRASFLVNPDTVIWQQKLIDKAILANYNLLLDGTLGGRPEPILQTMQRLRSEGYSVQVSVMAVPAYQSRLGIYQRYQDQVMLKGQGRWVGMGTHDAVYNQLPDRIDSLEQQQLIDQITLFARPVGNEPPALIYENRPLNGRREGDPKAGQALTAHRNRLLTYAEYKAHKAVVRDVQWQLEQTAPTPEKIREFRAHVEQTTTGHRVATAADTRLYFAWANDPITRQQSFNSAPISWEAHEAWFTRKINDPDALLLVFETNENVPIGQIRFERFDDELTATIVVLWPEVISLSMDAQFRGKGIASVLIEEACDTLRKNRGPVPIIAYIKLDNAASVRAFERVGFVRQDSGRPDRLRLVKH